VGAQKPKERTLVFTPKAGVTELTTRKPTAPTPERVGAQKPGAHKERTQRVDRDVFTLKAGGTELSTRKPTAPTPDERQQVMEEVALLLKSGGMVDSSAEEVWADEENVNLRSDENAF
jgi:hypothetical protein